MKIISENWKTVIIAGFTTLIGAVFLLWLDLITYHFYFKNQFDVNIEFATPLAQSKIGGEITPLEFMFNISKKSEFNKVGKNKIGLIGIPNLFSNNSILITNKNKIANVTLSSLKLNIDFKKFDIIFPMDKEKSYLMEMWFLSAIYDMVRAIDQKKILDTPQSISSKYSNKGVLEYFSSKIEDKKMSQNISEALKLIRENYIFYSRKGNYTKRGDAINFIFENDLFKDFNKYNFVNFAIFLKEYPVSILVNETKAIELPKILFSFLFFSSNKTIEMCFVGNNCQEVLVPKRYFNRLNLDDLLVSLTDGERLDSGAINQLTKDIQQKALDLNSDLYIEKFLSNLMIDEYRDIKNNLWSQYFSKIPESKDQIIYVEVLEYIFNKFIKSANNFVVKNRTEKKLFQDYVYMIKKSKSNFPPQIFAKSATEIAKKIIKNINYDAGCTEKEKESNLEILNNLQDVISFIEMYGNISFLIERNPEIKKIVSKYGSK